MRNSFNFYPVMYKILAVIVCFLLVLIYNKSKAANCSQDKKIIIESNTAKADQNIKQVMIDRISALYITEDSSLEDNV